MRAYAVGSVVAVAALSIGAPAMRASRTGGERSQDPRCTPIIQSTRPLTLPDGSLISIDASSAATDGHAILLAGQSVNLWPPRRPGGRSVIRSAAVGVLRDSAGRTHLVPAPVAPPFEFRALRVANDGRGAWHFLLLAGARRGTPVWTFGLLDSASVWYGIFDGRRWRQLTQISPAYNTRLLPEFSSELVVTRKGLAFAYSYDGSHTRNSSASSRQGIVLLSGSGADWKSDTLATWDAPGSVQLTPDTVGGVVAIFSQVYFANGRPRGPVLFSAVHDSAWQPPQRIWQPTSGYVSAPLRIARVRGTHNAPLTLLSWVTSAAGGVDADTLTWGVMGPDGTIRRIGPSIVADMWNSVAVTPAGDGGAVWLTRSDTAHDELRLIYARDTTVDDLGTLKLPFDNYYPVGGTLADGRLFVATMRVHLAQPQSATTYLTELAVRCSAAHN